MIALFLCVYWAVYGLLSRAWPDRIGTRLETVPQGRLWWPHTIGALRYWPQFAQWCRQAGVLNPETAYRLAFGGLSGALMLGVAVSLAVGACAPQLSLWVCVLSGGGAVLLGLVLGLWGLHEAISLHQDRLLIALPDVLDLIGLSLEGGVGLQMALHRCIMVSGGTQNPLMAVLKELRASTLRGERFHRALSKLQEDMRPPALKRFLELLGSVDRYGGTVIEHLQEEARHLREERRHRSRTRAIQVSLVLMIPLILLDLPALVVILVGPMALQWMQSIVGRPV